MSSARQLEKTIIHNKAEINYIGQCLATILAYRLVGGRLSCRRVKAYCRWDDEPSQTVVVRRVLPLRLQCKQCQTDRHWKHAPRCHRSVQGTDCCLHRVAVLACTLQLRMLRQWRNREPRRCWIIRQFPTWRRSNAGSPSVGRSSRRPFVCRSVSSRSFYSSSRSAPPTPCHCMSDYISVALVDVAYGSAFLLSIACPTDTPPHRCALYAPIYRRPPFPPSLPPIHSARTITANTPFSVSAGRWTTGHARRCPSRSNLTSVCGSRISHQYSIGSSSLKQARGRERSGKTTARKLKRSLAAALL